MSLQTIDSTLSGRNFFITGGTGFLGRILLEKLLRSCPNIGTIYLLMREKRGRTLDERVREISELPLFEKLQHEAPERFKQKVVAINGDITELRMGVSDADSALLVREINVIYHVAATVKFNQPLTEAILMNVRGTREVCKLALDCNKIQCLVHISTCYAHTAYKNVEEQMYPATADWRRCIQVAETLPKHTLQVVMGRYMEGFPNTYTYTKSLAEHVIHDLLEDRIPNVIIRPSIVVSVMDDPLPGWVDNYHGPYAMYLLGGLGMNRFVRNPHQRLDYVPADVCIKVFIAVLWNKLLDIEDSNSPSKLKTDVYNNSLYGYSDLVQSDIIERFLKLGRRYPFRQMVWYPAIGYISNPFLYFIATMLGQVIPALIFDVVLKIATGTTRLFKIQRTLHVANNSLMYFMINDWNFRNTKTFTISAKLNKDDLEAFNFSLEDFDEDEVTHKYVVGLKKYLLKEPVEDDGAKLRLKIFYVLHWLVKLTFYYILFRLAFKFIRCYI